MTTPQKEKKKKSGKKKKKKKEGKKKKKSPWRIIVWSSQTSTSHGAEINVGDLYICPCNQNDVWTFNISKQRVEEKKKKSHYIYLYKIKN